MKSGDPHEVANAIINGTALREMRDGSGMKMTDTRLVKVFATNNPWVRDVYELACGYVHLSDHHIRHFLARSKQNAAGLRDFAIGDEDEHVSGEHKVQLIDAFAVLTRGVLGMVRQWSAVRDAYGSNEQLRSKFNAPI